GDFDDERLATAVAIELDGRLAAPNGGQERNGQARLEAPTGPRPGRSTAATDPAQEILEDSAGPVRLLGCRPPGAPRAQEVTEVECEGAARLIRGPFGAARAGPGCRHSFDRGLAVAVIERSLFGVGQDVVCLLRLLELGLGPLVSRVDVGVLLAGQLAVG